MNDKPEGFRRLLDDVLADRAYAEFRDELRRGCIDELRRRRRARRQALAGALVGVAAAGLVALLLAGRSVPARAPSTPPEERRAAVPEPSPHVAAVIPAPPASPEALASDRAEGERVEVEIISDAELLAMLGDRPCGIIEVAPGRKRLWLGGPDGGTLLGGRD